MSLRIGIIAPNWVGDAVMAIPFLNACRRIYPEASIIVLSKTWVGAIYENHPALDAVLTMDKQFQQGFRLTTQYGKDLRSLELDRIFLLSNSFRSAYIAWLSRTPHRIGFPGQGRSFFLTQVVPRPLKELHRSRRYLELLQFLEPGYLDESASIKDPGIYLTKREKEWAKKELDRIGFHRPIGIFPFSVAPARNIPFEKIVEIVKATDGSVLIFGNTGDREPGERLAHLPLGVSIKSLCGDYTLREVIALIHYCRGAIASDSGLGHIAADMGVPTVSLFGAGDARITAPMGPYQATINKQVYCSPCRKNVCRNRREPLVCLHTLSGTEIWKVLKDLIRNRASSK